MRLQFAAKLIRMNLPNANLRTAGALTLLLAFSATLVAAQTP
jgi:hypothetical protein